VIIREEDCGTMDGTWIHEPKEKGLLPSFAVRIVGRLAAADIIDPESGEVIVSRNDMIDEQKAKDIVSTGIKSIYARSPLSCQSQNGLCRLCYGRDLSNGRLVDLSTAVGIIAAQSIGEPGTQLTLRTFHTGGVVGLDITSGLPRVEELFEARPPKAQAIISEIDGEAQIFDEGNGRRIKITSMEIFSDDYPLPEGWQIEVKSGQWVDIGSVLARPKDEKKTKTSKKEVTSQDEPVVARVSGEAVVEDGQLSIKFEETEEREYIIPAATSIRIEDGGKVKAGQQLTDGSINPHDILIVLGKEAAQRYLVDEVQKVYCSQGVHINDKHIEVIVRQMLSKVRIDSPGDYDLVTRELIDRFRYEEINAKVLSEGGEPATAHPVLMGITRASLSTDSWLAAASFQETTRVLTEAAVFGKVDRLSGLKENVIIGKLIPARCQACKEASEEAARRLEEAEEAKRLEASVGELRLSPEETSEETGNEACEEVVDEAGSEEPSV
ncbi:MAG TPA: DNA-directed RNA polymerase subunit beta', partial [Dehalococcoidia bacterium]|nr:DNA-directed RNA polymerase subunit beta' [Dehalococcoidia bacterium]